LNIFGTGDKIYLNICGTGYKIYLNICGTGYNIDLNICGTGDKVFVSGKYGRKCDLNMCLYVFLKFTKEKVSINYLGYFN